MKAEEIEALGEFCRKIEKINESDPGGAYLMEFAKHELKIAQNIKNDFPALVGVYVEQAELDRKVKELAAAHSDADKWDIRKLRNRQRTLEAQLQEQAETAAKTEEELLKLTERLND